MSPLQKELAKFDYSFPEELIAQTPAKPRDSARLLVYSRQTGKIVHSSFGLLPRFIPKGALLIFNKTKVLPARLVLKKKTGGLARVLYLSHDDNFIKALAPKLLRPGERLALGRGITFEVLRREGRFYYLRPSFPMSEIFGVLEKFGEAPLPPYIKRPGLSGRKLRDEYQSVFARVAGSVAAPTASLHFTEELMNKLRKLGVEERFITLHVGLGTFAPVTEENLASGTLHDEYYRISPGTLRAILNARRAGRPIIAVGTTALRAVESAFGAVGEHNEPSGEGWTNLFIRPGYKFRAVDGLVTNFHVPKSSLLMLVAAFMGRGAMLRSYREAVKNGYRLFSFGDGMLII